MSDELYNPTLSFPISGCDVSCYDIESSPEELCGDPFDYVVMINGFSGDIPLGVNIAVFNAGTEALLTNLENAEAPDSLNFETASNGEVFRIAIRGATDTDSGSANVFLTNSLTATNGACPCQYSATFAFSESHMDEIDNYHDSAGPVPSMALAETVSNRGNLNIGNTIAVINMNGCKYSFIRFFANSFETLTLSADTDDATIEKIDIAVWQRDSDFGAVEVMALQLDVDPTTLSSEPVNVGDTGAGYYHYIVARCAYGGNYGIVTFTINASA